MGLAQRSSSTLRLLVVDADIEARQILRSALEARIARPMMILETGDAGTARAMLAERSFDVMAVDLATVGGPEGFAGLVERSPSVVSYALGLASDVQAAVATVRLGAADFIEKPIDGAAFARRVERQFVDLKAANAEEFEGLIGRAPVMIALYDQIQRVAPSAAPVFITGGPGTGKALIARAVHARSRRRNGPFITLDCVGRSPDQLIADLSQPGGPIDAAQGGTLFLDEVGYLTEPAQALLARFLDTTEIASPEGVRRVSLRVIASSGRPIEDLRGPAGLRQDLFFRLNVLTLAAPALAERREDVPLLLDALIRKANREIGSRYTRFTGEALQLLTDHDWPGNVRELKAVIDLLITQHDGDLITGDRVLPCLNRPAAAEQPAPQPARRRPQDIRPLWMEEARLIEEAIAAFEGNIARAAAALGISPSTIYRKRRDAEDASARQVA